MFFIFAHDAASAVELGLKVSQQSLVVALFVHDAASAGREAEGGNSRFVSYQKLLRGFL